MKGQNYALHTSPRTTNIIVTTLFSHNKAAGKRHSMSHALTDLALLAHTVCVRVCEGVSKNPIATESRLNHTFYRGGIKNLALECSIAKTHDRKCENIERFTTFHHQSSFRPLWNESTCRYQDNLTVSAIPCRPRKQNAFQKLKCCTQQNCDPLACFQPIRSQATNIV